MHSRREVCVKLLAIGERQARLAAELKAEQKATDDQIALAAALRDETLDLAGELMEMPVALSAVIASAAKDAEDEGEDS